MEQCRENKAAIVTGASSGIGAAISARLCEMGYEVFGIGRSFGSSFAEQFPDAAGNPLFHAVVCDLLDTEKMLKMVREIAAEAEVTLLVNNAGSAYYGLHEELNPKKIQEMVRTDLEVPMILSQQLLRGFKKNKGCIVNIASVTAQQSNPHGCAYGAVKAGLASFSRSLFDEARKYGVRVAVVSPDMTKTELYRNADFTVGEETESYLLPQDVADAVAYIVGQREGVAVSEVTLRPQYPAQAGSEKGETGRMKDLTKGKPSTLILAFALPIFLGNLLQLTYSVTDTRIVGSFLGEDALAAVGATTTLSNLIIGFLLGLANGFAIITAQRFGAKDIRGVKKSFAASLVLGTVISVVLTVLGLVFLQPILRFLNVPEHLIPVAGPYIFIIIAGLLATFLYDACAAALRALGDTVTPLVILAVSVALNIAGDLLFVLVLKAGVRGAAAATVLAQILAFVICWLYMLRRYEMLRLVREDFRDADMAMMKNMLGSGLSMGFMSSLVNIGSLTLQTAINKLGQDIIVAHTAARKISEIFMTMFSVFGQTMATYCGQNLGAGRIDRVKKGIRLGIFYTCIWCTLSAVASYTIGRWLVYLVTGSTNEVVILNATSYLKFDTLFYYVTAVICVLRNAMQGLGDHITPLISSSLEMVGKIVIAATLVPMLGYTGVIVAEPLVWFIMVIPLVVQIFRMPVLREENRGNQGK